MKRYAIAVALGLAAGTAADAQFPLNPPAAPGPVPPLGGQFITVGPPPPMPSLNPPPVPGPLPTPGPPVVTPGIGFYKSGGVFVGADGSFPYDTGTYLLAGTDGFARSTGTFTMVPPAPPPGPAAGPAACGPRCRLFRR